uniref:Caspase 8 associated protein 2 n=1 Tax=Kryptolebias marmoratus TaxID=37003 RepID=A0A3Q3ACM2_KRYMA
MESSDASDSMIPAVSEDSVDIYDGLDVGVCTTEEKSPVNSELKESLDLYEDIVAEEHLSRTSSYTDLKSRFQAAQNQIKGLRRRLEQMETQNTGLSKENICLKKNISALLRTARQEVMRKDAEIQKLTQWTERGYHNRQFRTKSLQNLNSSTILPISRPTLLPPPSPPPPFSSSQSREDHLSGHLCQSSRKERSSSTSSRSAKSSPHVKRDTKDTDKQSSLDKQRFRGREEKCSGQKLSEPTDKRPRDCSRPNKDSRSSEKESSHREDNATGRKYDSPKNQRSSYVKGQWQPARAKSSSQESLHRRRSSSINKRGGILDQRPDKSKMVTSDCDNVSPEYKKIKSNHKPERHSYLKDQKNSSSHQHVEASGNFHKETKKYRQKDYQRKDDRGHKGETKRRHNTSRNMSEASKKHDKWKPKDLNKGNVDLSASNRQERVHEVVKGLSDQTKMDEKNSVNENNPNRKLCFMETLNLTLSPNKKPLQPMDGSSNVLTSVENDIKNEQAEEDSQANMEDMCIIDELEIDPKYVTEQYPDNLKVLSPESVHKKVVDVKSVQEKDKILSDIAGSAVQTILSHSQSLDTSENQMTEHLIPKCTDYSSLKAKNSLKHNEDTIELVSNSHVTEPERLHVINKSHPSNMAGSISKHHRHSTLQNIQPRNVIDPTSGVKEHGVADLDEIPVPLKVSQNTSVEVAVSSHSEDSNVFEGKGEKASLCSSHLCEQDFCPPSTSITREKEKDCCGLQDGTKAVDFVSSTISLDSFPQEGVSLTEAIYVLTQVNVDASKSSIATNHPSSSTDCIGVSKVSSTTEEEPLPEKYSIPTVTPKKSFSASKIQGTNMKTSSSVPSLHDEDSMMCTLNNLKKIPDAISPLRSPVRITKQSLVYVQNKPGHVKSLQKDFLITSDPSSKKLDINKENKYPGSTCNHDTENLVNEVSDLPLSLSDTELEEGEILSESEETALSLPVPAAKRPKLTDPVRNKPSSPSVLKRKSGERPDALKETHETDSVSTHSPRSRFKTVCPAGSRDSFFTIEEVMETFKLVRSEIRKKYMKLHKTFPKKSFYGVMDNFEKSFLEFVDGADFGQLCCQVEELKSKLKKQISSVFIKVINNGIVKRIFEQQAVDLKQKLWDFVDVQVDYLFKDIHTILKNLCKTAKSPAKEKRSGEERKESQQTPANNLQKDPHSPSSSLNQINSCAVIPYKTGLGSRGKDIRMTCAEKDGNAILPLPNHQNAQTLVENLHCTNLPSTPEKNKITSLVVSQNCSMVDKTDFELLTEQQTSSLTYNLVRDSQMGEIFKCLLQGSDLLESSGITGDHTAWSLGTPRKDEERFLSITTPSIFTSPSKFDTPNKLIAAWSSISPRKIIPPRVKDQMPLNPALFDESCLLEVPSERVLLQTSQKSYSILAEDLAVSLTLPSPLKSDSHLSFLQPSSLSMQMSTPDSVISAHISEDALLDEEDATEQDIHLALDTDISSSSSSSSMITEIPATPFVFKFEVPMKALVMEKSNDHFIVKIRQANMNADISQTANENFSGTVTNQNQQCTGNVVSAKESEAASLSSGLPSENISNCDQEDICITLPKSITLLNHPPHKSQGSSTQQNPSKDCFTEECGKNLPCYLPTDNSQIRYSSTSHHYTVMDDNTKSQEHTKVSPSESSNRLKHATEIPVASQQSQAHVFDLERDDTGGSKFEKSFTIDTSASPKTVQKGHNKISKRKKPQEKMKSKRSRNEEEESQGESCSSKKNEFKSSLAALSPSRVSAKNVVKKKGEVVMAWTRDEDRTILVDLKTNGASRETFSALSEKLNKPSGQVNSQSP